MTPEIINNFLQYQRELFVYAFIGLTPEIINNFLQCQRELFVYAVSGLTPEIINIILQYQRKSFIHAFSGLILGIIYNFLQYLRELLVHAFSGLTLEIIHKLFKYQCKQSKDFVTKFGPRGWDDSDSQRLWLVNQMIMKRVKPDITYEKIGKELSTTWDVIHLIPAFKFLMDPQSALEDEKAVKDKRNDVLHVGKAKDIKQSLDTTIQNLSNHEASHEAYECVLKKTNYYLDACKLQLWYTTS